MPLILSTLFFIHSSFFLFEGMKDIWEAYGWFCNFWIINATGRKSLVSNILCFASGKILRFILDVSLLSLSFFSNGILPTIQRYFHVESVTHFLCRVWCTNMHAWLSRRNKSREWCSCYNSCGFFSWNEKKEERKKMSSSCLCYQQINTWSAKEWWQFASFLLVFLSLNYWSHIHIVCLMICWLMAGK